MDIGTHSSAIPKVGEMLNSLENIQRWVHHNMVEANEKYKKDAYKLRRELSFAKGDFCDGPFKKREISI